ncbi:MAG: zinc ribbon domain-containing protein [Acidobacteriota bacterium]|jgi:hypothetical protein|nr:zinc ribbon domain-containing protein [Acidobacteriota bacterium]
MFCPKCGTQNPDNGKFCRQCGTDLGNISDAISGKLSKSNSKNLKGNKKGKTDWESSVGTMFGGLAFLIISIILAFQPMGRGWWFWMLIPAFSMLGKGFASIIQMRSEAKKDFVGIKLENDINSEQIKSNNFNNLPPKQTEFVSNIPEVKYETGDLIPPSVIENTTRHLEMDSEGETMTLPKVNK